MVAASSQNRKKFGSLFAPRAASTLGTPAGTARRKDQSADLVSGRSQAIVSLKQKKNTTIEKQQRPTPTREELAQYGSAN